MKVLICIFLFPLNLFSFVELSGEYGLAKTAYGENNINEIENITYSGSIAFYFFEMTALELGMQLRKSNNQQEFSVSDQISVTKINYIVESKNYSIGLKQNLAKSTSWIIPTISLGYSKRINEYKTDYTIFDPGENEEIVLEGALQEDKQDNSFIGLSLKFRITERIHLKASMSSFFEAFKFEQWDQDLRYLVGFSIYLF